MVSLYRTSKDVAYLSVLRMEGFKDADMVYRLPPSGRAPNAILPSDLACKETQITPNETFGSPILTVSPCSTLKLMYQENGHVTRIGKDSGHRDSGTISVFGKVNSSPADTLQGLFEAANQGSDVRLLAKRSFDDGSCYEDNGTPVAEERKSREMRRPLVAAQGPNVWCELEVTLPIDTVASDHYTLFWIWEFDGVNFVEKYTTCIDVTIVH